MTGLFYALPSLAGTALSLYMARYAVIHRLGPAWRYLVAFAIVSAWWCAGQWALILTDDPDVRFRIVQLQFLAKCANPVLWLQIGLIYSGRRRWLKLPWPGALLWVIPAITIVLVATGGRHHLIWERFESVAGAPRVLETYGSWFWVHVAYGYTAVVAGTLLLGFRFADSPLYRRSSVAIILAPGIVFVANVVHVTARTWLPLDPTPTALVLSFAMIAVTLRRDQFLSLLPLARGVTVETLHEGVVVIGSEDRVVDVNPAARALLGRLELGSPLAAALPSGTSLHPGPAREVRLPSGRRIDVTITSVSADEGAAEGRVVLLRDVTDERDAQDRLLKAHEELQELNRELERLAHTDTLTGLANRRRLMARLDEEWARCRRYRHPLALLIVDLDHFKHVNDQMGHLVGDRVLEAVGAALAGAVRSADVAARYGGEEFAVLLPESGLAGATELAGRVCRTLRDLDHRNEQGTSFRAPASIGVAALLDSDQVPADLLARADAALYHIKQSGRNGVSVFEGGQPRRLDV